MTQKNPNKTAARKKISAAGQLRAVKSRAKTSAEGDARDNASQVSVRVCVGTGGIAAGSLTVIETFRKRLAEKGVAADVDGMVHKVGCRGFCARDVLVDVTIKGTTHTYQHITPEIAERIVDEHIIAGTPVSLWLSGDDYRSFHERQQKVVLANCGHIDPESIDAYVAARGYKAAEVALSLPPKEIVEKIKRSGLRGRGGAGFPTGLKWELCRAAAGDLKYIICNGDEGDPGAFMDRSVVEGNPHAVIEGMIIGAYAITAPDRKAHGYVYIRAEYPLAVDRLRLALLQAREHGLLGKNIFGSGWDFDIKVVLGAGAFVCGEETALIASIEDKIGEPRPKPPFPINSGLWGKPTTINNVETWANVPVIINRGENWFASIGTPKSKGTKIFSLVGKIKNTGLVEVPMGIPLRQIIYDIGGGIPKDRKFKAVQTGGPSGGCIPAELLDLPVDYENLTQAGSIMGSGGMVVMDEDTCMVDVAKFFVSFCHDESCGQCLPCREGTREMVKLLEKITTGKASDDDVVTLEALCDTVRDASLCGLGKTAPNPVFSTLKYFRNEYEAHIRDKKCPAGVCRELITFSIDPAKCTGCTLCTMNCPQKAITGDKKEPHTIDQKLCVKCRSCYIVCNFKAVKIS